MNSGSVVRVRYFQKSDEAQVRALFKTGMTVGPGSPQYGIFQRLLAKLKLLLPFTGAVAAFLVILKPSYWILSLLILLVAPSLLVGRYYIITALGTGYVEQSLTEDLWDIGHHYGMAYEHAGSETLVPSGAGAFWVAECDLPDESGTEIVGTIALDCSMKDGKMHGELRRMIISPQHRRKGIASLLIRTLLSRARDLRLPAVTLTTTEFQEGALKMYKAFGWVETGKDAIRFGPVGMKLIHLCNELSDFENGVTPMIH